MGEGLLLFLIMLGLSQVRAFRGRPGMVGGMFLMGYAIFRSIAENYRSPDPQLGFIYEQLTMGQILCVPMGLLGLGIVIWSARQPLPLLDIPVKHDTAQSTDRDD